MSHLQSHITHPELRSDNTLHVIGVVSNTEQYHSRYRLTREWAARMATTANVRLQMVEATFGDRLPEIDSWQQEGFNVHRVQMNTNCWLKENLINIGVRQLPSDWKYLAWVDCDLEFRDPSWALKTLHQLQHFPVLQPWQQCVDLGFGGSILQTHQSFGHLDQAGVRKQQKPGEPYQYAHSGYAWACTRRFYEEVEGLLDFAILGSADHHMAWAMIGQVEHSVHGNSSEGFKRRCLDWQRKAQRACNSEVGFVPGRIEHHFHGSKQRRFYRERWEIIIEHGFDPDTDLRRDANGLYYLHSKPALEAAIRKYNRSRNEDSIEDL